MKIERSKEWWMARARREGDAAVGAGLLAFDPVPDERPTTITQTAAAEETRIAFGEWFTICGGNYPVPPDVDVVDDEPDVQREGGDPVRGTKPKTRKPGGKPKPC